jgi:hypothetical protein
MIEPPMLTTQHGAASVVPAEVLDDALLWDYSFSFWIRDESLPSQMSLAITLNEERTATYELLTEDANGLLQIRVTPPDIAVMLDAATPVAMGDGVFQYRRQDGTMVGSEDWQSMSQRTIVLTRLNIIDVQSARGSADGVTFDAPYLPSLESTSRFDIGSGPNTLAGHLTTLLHGLLGNAPFATQQLSLACHYGYTIGGMPVRAPVLLVSRQELSIGFDELLIEEIAGSIGQWLAAVQPPANEARLIFDLTVWNATRHTEAVLLHLGELSLAMENVIG